MWCQNCGKYRAHYHEISSYKAKYCQRCRTRSTTAHTYCRYCGEFRSDRNPRCDVHGRNSGGSGRSCATLMVHHQLIGNPIASSSSGNDSPPTYSPPAYGSDEDDDDATDLSSPRSISPASRSSSSSSGTSDEPKKCGFCELWFESNSDYNDHADENNSGCSKHKLCFSYSDNYQHAKDSYHVRCFVPGCDSYYADSDYTDKEIVKHVWQEHTDRG